MAVPMTIVEVDTLLDTHDRHGLKLTVGDAAYVGTPADNPKVVRELLRLARTGALAERSHPNLTAAQVVDMAQRDWERMSPP